MIEDQYTYEVSREEAQQLLEDIKYNKSNDNNYLVIKAAYHNKKLPSKAFIEMAEELQILQHNSDDLFRR
ncbi:hypothetical protein DM558_12375 [Entomomonas moraniae]|uniref:Uncharacterized protein n=1 Tax=Entomomonas moraniae TaxID=2213226 RepID=A0A3Q9JK71_9GAMM|nr:hypothetical protein [Entomomonas moraniae]AZS51515.1 hypothetical protein DM558_12375 [Entomomonas moraniae]